MDSKKSTRAKARVSKPARRKHTAAEAHDMARRLMDDLMDQLCTLQLIYCTVDRCQDTDPSEEFSAVRNQLDRSLTSISAVHTQADVLTSYLSHLTDAQAREVSRG